MDFQELKNKLESLLFSAGRWIELEELARLCREQDVGVIQSALESARQELDAKNSALLLINEGSRWKLAVRDKYLPFVKKVVSKTELSKALLETLSVVALKSPVLQSQVIRLRNNKAYAHLSELEKVGYITREKKGHTKLIKLAQKFFEYFDVPAEKLQEKLEKKAEPRIEVVEEKLAQLEVYETAPFEGAPPNLGELEVYEKGGKHKKKSVQEAAAQESSPDTAAKPSPEPIIQQQTKPLTESSQPPETPKLILPTAPKAKETPPSNPKSPETKPSKSQTPKAPETAEAQQPAPEAPPSAPLSFEQRLEMEISQTKQGVPVAKGTKGMFPQGVPEDVQKRVDKRVKEIVEGEPKPETEDEHHHEHPHKEQGSDKED